MKSLYIVMCGLFTAAAINAQTSIQVNAQEGSTVRLTCQVSDYQVVHDGIYTDIDFVESTPVLKVGAPQVNQLTGALIVDDHNAMAVSVTHAVYEEFNDVYMRPSKGNLLRTIDPETVPYQEGAVYSVNSFYPGQLAALGSPYVQHQFRGQSIHFYPVQYNPVTHVMRVYSSIEVTVSSTGNPGVNPLPVNVTERTTLPIQEVYQAHFLNYAQNSQRYTQVSEIGNMLVITDAQYVGALQPWVQWKKEKGIPVEIVDVATINSVTAISNYLQQYYEANGLTYLVLVGDENQVPVELVNNSGGQGYCDACYGYVAGIDSYADLFVGHFLVHNASELQPFIAKVLEYERTPNTAVDWFSVAMGLGSNQGDGIGDDGQADWAHQNGIKTDLLSYTYTEVYEKYDGAHATSSPTGGLTADASGSPSASSLTDVIESGCSLINYTGHGAHTLIVTGSYTNTQINALQNNGRYPYFIVVGCCTGDYDDDDDTGETFGESWIKSPSSANLTGGIGGAFSSVYQSWAPPMEAQDEMNKIITETAAIQTRHTLGSIHYHGCASMNDAYGAGGDEMTDTWVLMADPTMQLRTAMPLSLTATHDAGAVMGVSTLMVGCNVNDAMVCATFNGEILDAQIVVNGQVILNFNAVSEPGSILITATAFNAIPYQGWIIVTPATGPYVVGHVTGINDTAGNGNGLADYNEQIGISINASNIGVDVATNITATVSCANTFVVIDDNSYSFGTLIAGQTVDAANGFTFHLDGPITDQTAVIFVVTYTDSNGNTWSSNLPVVIQAPEFECANTFDVNDSQGNGNGRIDGGETVTITFPITNSGHASTAVAVDAQLSTSVAGVTIVGGLVNLGSIAPGQTVNASFTLAVDASLIASTAIDLSLNLPIAYYGMECVTSVTANRSIEDWETGNDNSYPWNYSGNADWFVTNQYAYEGTYSMESGNVNDNQVTSMLIDVNASADFEMSFSFKTSTEDGYDFLSFEIDNLQRGSWSGDNDWTVVSYLLPAGAHTLSWNYTKDFTVSSGEDACWVDNIVLPAMPVGLIERAALTSSLTAYPNPASDAVVLSIHTNQPTSATCRVFDAAGRLMHEQRSMQLGVGMHTLPLETLSWPAGAYSVQLITISGVSSTMLIKQ
jgi:hypothetical protein